jgi:hypothetical protein
LSKSEEEFRFRLMKAHALAIQLQLERQDHGVAFTAKFSRRGFQSEEWPTARQQVSCQKANEAAKNLESPESFEHSALGLSAAVKAHRAVATSN